MKTQIKKFDLNLLKHTVLDAKSFINKQNNIEANAIERYYAGIPQMLIYATEDYDGNFTILENNVIMPLLGHMLKEDLHIRDKRQLGMYQIQICILTAYSDEELEEFKRLTAINY